MKLECTYKKMKAKDRIFLHTQEKLNKVEELFNYPLHCRLTLVAQRYNVKVELRVDGNNAHMSSTAEHENVYAAIDEAIEKIYKQLSKKKAKMKDRRGKRNLRQGNLLFMDEFRAQYALLKKAN